MSSKSVLVPNQNIDINIDVGEGFNNEAQLMPYVMSCNIACGGHAGDAKTMRNVVKIAKKHGVKIGAHPSFPNKTNFGRKPMKMSATALFKSLKQQIDDLITIINAENAILHHIKPHGALYHLARTDSTIAETIVDVFKSIELPIKLYVPYQSVIETMALQNNIPIVYEAFADRNYNDDLSLVSRNQPMALIQDATIMYNQVMLIVNHQKVITITGKEVAIKAETFCVHGDHKNAEILLKNLYDKLNTNDKKTAQ